MQAVIDDLRNAYAALGQGDEHAALAMLAKDCEWHESEELPDVQVVRGKAAVAKFLRSFLESWERFEQEVEDVVVHDDRIGLAIHLTAVGRTSGLEVNTRYAHVWTIREGLGIRVDAYRDPESMRAVLFGASTEPPAPSASESTQKPA